MAGSGVSHRSMVNPDRHRSARCECSMSVSFPYKVAAGGRRACGSNGSTAGTSEWPFIDIRPSACIAMRSTSGSRLLPAFTGHWRRPNDLPLVAASSNLSMAFRKFHLANPRSQRQMKGLHVMLIRCLASPKTESPQGASRRVQEWTAFDTTTASTPTQSPKILKSTGTFRS